MNRRYRRAAREAAYRKASYLMRRWLERRRTRALRLFGVGIGLVVGCSRAPTEPITPALSLCFDSGSALFQGLPPCQKPVVAQ